MSKENFDFRSIQSFVDACQSLGIAPVLPEISMLPDDLQKSVIANYKLLIVYKAINNGWTPDWSDENQYKYFPWFGVLSSGSGFSAHACVYSYSRSGVGSRLCTDSSEKALYIAETFEQEYIDAWLYTI